jgi:hypothetical protein
MYDVEVCVLDKVEATELVKTRLRPQTLEEGREAEILYDKKIIRIDLTKVWALAYGDYDTFVDELVGTILHEYLHYFFHVNKIFQNEELTHHLSNALLVLSLGHLIGAANEKDEDVKAYEKWLNARFTK